MPDEEATPEPDRRAGGFRPVETAQQMTEETARRLIGALEGSAPIRHIRGSQIVSALLATVGLALVLTGIEIVVQNTSYLDNGWGAILLGLGLLFASGLLLQKLIKGE
jgi:hypothetical protein